jgi:hypothetical protein
MPFYRTEGTTYNEWFMGNLPHEAQMSQGARQRACSMSTAMWLRSGVDHVNPYPRIDAWASSRPGGRRFPRQWAKSPDLTGLHVID